jgi:hypothetical protein
MLVFLSSLLHLDPDAADGQERRRRWVGDQLVDRLFTRQQLVGRHHPCVRVIKLFLFVPKHRGNKLECLSLASSFVLVLF